MIKRVCYIYIDPRVLNINCLFLIPLTIITHVMPTTKAISQNNQKRIKKCRIRKHTKNLISFIINVITTSASKNNFTEKR